MLDTVSSNARLLPILASGPLPHIDHARILQFGEQIPVIEGNVSQNSLQLSSLSHSITIPLQGHYNQVLELLELLAWIISTLQ